LARVQSSRSTLVGRGSHVAAAHRVSAHISSQALHRKAEVHTASLRR
jgi:hypothetical protein